MPKTILLADDSVTIQKVVGISFANEDVVLLTVDNGDDAVARARESRPDLVLADIAMPGLDGYAVCEAIKSDPALQHVPVLLLSGTFETFDDERAREVRADGHITKPFEAQALVDRVNDLLARAEADRPVAGAATTVLVSEPPSAVDAFEFFDDELATPEPAPAPQAAPSATMLLDEADDEIPLEPVAAEPLELENADESGLDLPGDEPLEMAQVEEDAPVADGHATMLFDGADPSAPPPIPVNPSFEETRSSRTPWVADAPAPGAATQLLDEPEADAALDFGFDAEEPAAASPALRDTATIQTSPIAPHAPDDDAGEDLFESEIEPEPAPTPPPVPAAATAPPIASAPASAHLDALRSELREHLEKVAWEAFGDLSERIVRETVARVEAVAWEVIPQMAETLIREEIRKLQGED